MQVDSPKMAEFHRNMKQLKKNCIISYFFILYLFYIFIYYNQLMCNYFINIYHISLLYKL